LTIWAFGPIFATSTKSDAATPWGLRQFAELRRRTRQTLVAIGGIDAANASQVIEAGADGIAVVSAICAAADPELAARDLRRIVIPIAPSRSRLSTEPRA
jgi:thiamine-phosphate pyrophosphorylase